MYPHRIRLRGPWECEPLARRGELPAAARPTDDRPDGLPPPAPCRLTVPVRLADTELAGFIGRLQLRRRFGYPGSIDAHERVWLTVGAAGDAAEAWLNGRSLGRVTAEDGGEFEVTALLAARNELLIEVDVTARQDLPCGAVALEVRRTAFLRSVRAWRAGDELHVEGKVVGQSDGPLELYAVLGRRTAAYETVTPTAEGRPFHVVACDVSTEWWGEAEESCHRSAGVDGGGGVKVELVGGGSIWYSSEVAWGSA
jgi:hypothetical protein